MEDLLLGGVLSCASIRILVAGVLAAALVDELLLLPALHAEETEDDWVLDGTFKELSAFSGVQGITPLQ